MHPVKGEVAITPKTSTLAKTVFARLILPYFFGMQIFVALSVPLSLKITAKRSS